MASTARLNLLFWVATKTFYSNQREGCSQLLPPAEKRIPKAID
jgi:hypothetical protein